MRGEKPIRIGVGSTSYGSKRCFQGIVHPSIQFIRKPQVPLQALGSRLSLGNVSESMALFLPGRGSADLLHTFNAIPLNGGPCVVSFESILPRLWGCPKLKNFLLRRLAHPSCKAILALSQNAKLHVALRNESHPDLGEILDKLRVIDPGVEPPLEEGDPVRFDRETLAKAFHVVFVGNDFFRKGGVIAARAVEVLKREHPVRFSVVSTFQEHNYVFPTAKGEGVRWKEKLRDIGAELHESIPFQAVQRLMRTAHVLLLPTFDDSFGYSVVEAMSVGTVPIATDVRALPEVIEDGRNGLLIHVPKTAEGRIRMAETSMDALTDALLRALKTCLEDHGRLASLSREGLRTYSERFSMDQLAKRIGSVYGRALS